MGAIQNGFQIVNVVVAAGGEGLPFARIVDKTGLPKASVHRLLKDLVDVSALVFEPVTRRYSGGLQIARLGAQLLSDYDLRRIAHPHLIALHKQTGHVATLGILANEAGIYIDKIEGRDFGIRLHSEIGKPFPLHCTGMGKVLLAGAPRDLQKRLTSRKLDGFTDNTITNGAALRRELVRVAEEGYAVDHEEITRGLMCVAAPVLDAWGRTAGALSCTFPSYVFHEQGIAREIDAVCLHARAASGLREAPAIRF